MEDKDHVEKILGMDQAFIRRTAGENRSSVINRETPGLV